MGNTVAKVPEGDCDEGSGSILNYFYPNLRIFETKILIKVYPRKSHKSNWVYQVSSSKDIRAFLTIG